MLLNTASFSQGGNVKIKDAFIISPYQRENNVNKEALIYNTTEGRE